MSLIPESDSGDVTEERSFAPRYHQVYQELHLRIRSGRWLPGDPIPSEAELCKLFGVSRGTIQRAVRDLVEQGLLRRERGRATYVCSPKLEGSVLASYQDSITRPHDAGAEVIRCDRVAPSEEISRIMALEPGEAVYELERLRFVRDVPLSLQLSYLPASLCPNLENCELGDIHLHDVLQNEYNVSFLKAEEFVEPARPDAYVANLLRINGDHPVFYVERLSYVFGGRIGEFRRAYMRGDLYRLRIELR